MGKRSNVEKPSSTNMLPQEKESGHIEVTNTAIFESEEPYHLTNNFSQDFGELAKRAGFPDLHVATRAVRPCVQAKARLDSAPTPAKKDDKKFDDKYREPSPVADEAIEPQPTTYTLQNKFDFFKPTVQVVYDEEGLKNMIKELYIKGWLVDRRILNVLGLTLPSQEKLTKIELWNVGLTDELFESFTALVKQLPSLRTLVLDGNPLNNEKYDILLSEDSVLQNLSCRNCKISDIGANRIGVALLTNKSLQTLNLNNNKIGCDGAIFLSKGLRMNRTLLSLDLSCNFISDVGVEKIAETLSRFVLNHEETVARRHLLSKKSAEESSSQQKSGGQSSSRNERPPSVRSGSHLGRDDRQKKDKQKGAKKDSKKVDDKPTKKASSTDAAKDSKKGKKTSLAKTEKKSTGGVTDQELSEVVEFPNPLLENVQEIGGELHIPGNRALINLNLSRNKIGEIGFRSLLNAVNYQTQLSTTNNKSNVIGLLRLSIQKNLVGEDNGVFNSLQELMTTRDPFYKLENYSREEITPIKELE